MQDLAYIKDIYEKEKEKEAKKNKIISSIYESNKVVTSPYEPIIGQVRIPDMKVIA